MTVAAGHYALKQLYCRSHVIAWSHATRFAKARELAGTDRNGWLLDYGCGDGTFLSLVADRFRGCVGTDIAVDQLQDCRVRFRSIPNVQFCAVDALRPADLTAAFQVVTCMETLEHCMEDSIERVLLDIRRLTAPGGRIILSVPIETGPTFLLKYVMRRMAAARGLGDYRYYEKYTLANALRMVLAHARTTLDRPIYGEPGMEWLSHYGFNWREMRARVATVLTVDRTVFTPLGSLGGWCSSQAWFICRPG